MTRDDIIRMAREAGIISVQENNSFADDMYISVLYRFAALVAAHVLVEPCCGNYEQCQKVCMPRARAAERKACAQLVADLVSQRIPASEYAEAIRARGDV